MKKVEILKKISTSIIRICSLIAVFAFITAIITVISAATGQHCMVNAAERQQISAAGDNHSKEAESIARKHVMDAVTVCNGIYYLKTETGSGIEIHRYGKTISVNQHEPASNDHSKGIDWIAPFEVNSPVEKSYYIKAKWNAPKGWQDPEMPIVFTVINKGGKWKVEGSFKKASCAEIASLR